MTTHYAPAPAADHRSAGQADRGDIASAFAAVKLLAAGYLGISALAVAAAGLLHGNPALVNSAVWTHGIIVAVSALATFALAVRASRGSRGAYRRLRIVSVVIVAAIVVVVALPGSFPLWMKAEQSVAGLCMAGIAVLVNSRRVRSVFTAR